MEAKMTAMQVLKIKIQDAIGEMNGELNLYESGYKQCLINIQNDIDAQMMQIERVQIIEAYASGSNDRLKNKFNDQYYKETYGKETDRS